MENDADNPDTDDDTEVGVVVVVAHTAHRRLDSDGSCCHEAAVGDSHDGDSHVGDSPHVDSHVEDSRVAGEDCYHPNLFLAVDEVHHVHNSYSPDCYLHFFFDHVVVAASEEEEDNPLVVHNEMQPADTCLLLLLLMKDHNVPHHIDCLVVLLENVVRRIEYYSYNYRHQQQ